VCNTAEGRGPEGLVFWFGAFAGAGLIGYLDKQRVSLLWCAAACPGTGHDFG